MFHNERWHRARSRHLCDGCRRSIPYGTLYVRMVGVSHGDLYSNAYHTGCWYWERVLNTINKCWGDEYTFLHEHVDGGGSDVLTGAPYLVKQRFKRVLRCG